MSKIDRYTGNYKPFGANSQGTERTIFEAPGATDTQSDTLDANINTDYLRGWGDNVVSASQFPTRQQFNAGMFTLGQTLSYLHQQGVPEWQASQEFYKHSVSKLGGALYSSRVDGNTGNSPDSTNSWVQVSAPILKSVQDIPGLTGESGDGAFLISWRPSSMAGSGILSWSGSTNKSNHDGVLVFSPTVPFSNENDYLAGVGETDPSGSGCWLLTSGEIIFPATVNIPTRYTDLQSAFDSLKSITCANNARISLNIEAAHALTKGLLIDRFNASHFNITSSDATVFLDPSFQPAVIDADISGIGTNNCIIGVQMGGVSPYINILIDANLKAGSGSGVVIVSSSTGISKGTGKGVINAEFFGFLVALNSKADFSGCNFSASNWGCRVTTGSSANVALSNFDGVRQATYGGSGTTAGLDVSRGSIVNFKGLGGTAKNCAARGIAARRSFLSAEEVDVSGAGTEGVRSENNSSIAFFSGVANNCGTTGVVASSSTLDCRSVSAQNCGLYGVLADDCSQINARDANVLGYTSRGIFSNAGSQINARDADARKDGINTAITDIVVLSGSNISASGAQGGTNIAVNTLLAEGVIYQ